MKRNIIKATAAILSLFCAACGPNSNQTEPADTSAVQGFNSNIEGVTVKDGISKYYLNGECTIDSNVIIGIQDRASEMSIDLFKAPTTTAFFKPCSPKVAQSQPSTSSCLATCNIISSSTQDSAPSLGVRSWTNWIHSV